MSQRPPYQNATYHKTEEPDEASGNKDKITALNEHDRHGQALSVPLVQKCLPQRTEI